MKRIGLLFALFTIIQIGQAQIVKHGNVEIPNEATLVCEVNRDVLTFSNASYPKPQLYYYESEGVFFIYILSLKPDKSFNACEITKLNTKKMTKENFKVESLINNNTTELTITTTDKKLMEMGTVFSFDSESNKIEFYKTVQNNYVLLDSEKAKEFVSKLGAK